MPEVLRVERGRPRLGLELDSTTIPQEAGLNERAVDFEKGCYVGQETVARLFYKGKPNRHLRGLRLTEPAERGAPIILGEKEVGAVGSAVRLTPPRRRWRWRSSVARRRPATRCSSAALRRRSSTSRSPTDASAPRALRDFPRETVRGSFTTLAAVAVLLCAAAPARADTTVQTDALRATVRSAPVRASSSPTARDGDVLRTLTAGGPRRRRSATRSTSGSRS